MLLFSALLLAGCGLKGPVEPSDTRVPAPQTLTQPIPTAYPVRMATVTSVPTGSLKAPPTAPPLQDDGAMTPGPGTPLPVFSGSPGPLAFHDCARTPGLVGCDPSAPAIAAELAVVDSSAGRLLGLDLRSGASWQVPGLASGLAWSPDGGHLLAEGYDAAAGSAAFLTPGASNDYYTLFDSGGSAQETFDSPAGVRWLPDNRLSLKGGALVADDTGRQAWLEMNGNLFDLHLLMDGKEQPTRTIVPQPGDRLYALRGWVPEIPGVKADPRLLAQRYFASNSAMLFGGEVLLLDLDPGSETVTERNLGVTAHLDDAAFAWNPAQPGLLAMIVTGKPRSDFSLDSNQPGPEGGQALALYDAAACSPPCSLRYPLPDGVPVDEIAWRPDGQRLAFVAGSLGPDASADAKSRFAEPGIYLLDPKSGATEPVAKGQNGWPNWSADGKTLVYTRGIPLPDGSPGVQVVALDMTEQGGGKEWVLVQGLPAPDTLAGRTPWEKVVAFSLVK